MQIGRLTFVNNIYPPHICSQKNGNVSTTLTTAGTHSPVYVLYNAILQNISSYQLGALA